MPGPNLVNKLFSWCRIKYFILPASCFETESQGRCGVKLTSLVTSLAQKSTLCNETMIPNTASLLHSCHNSLLSKNTYLWFPCLGRQLTTACSWAGTWAAWNGWIWMWQYKLCADILLAGLHQPVPGRPVLGAERVRPGATCLFLHEVITSSLILYL